MGRRSGHQPPFPRPPVYAAYFAEATKAKKASSFAKASTVAGGYGGQDGGQDDRQAGPTQWLFQGPPAESKFLAAKQAEIETEILSLLGNPVLTTGQKQQVCIAAHALYKAWPEKKDRSIEVLRKMEQYAPASDLGQAAKNLRNHLSPSKP